LGKAFKIESRNGLHPLAKGARVAFAKGKPSVTEDRSSNERSVGRLYCW